MSYLGLLEDNENEIKKDLDRLIDYYKVQPVGFGYIDMITTKDNITGFVTDLSEKGIAIEALTWWCYCSSANKVKLGCPHGMGGTKSWYFDGWFSEMGLPIVNFELEIQENCRVEDIKEKIKENNDKVINYIFNYFPKCEDYIKCIIPGFWLSVPDKWRNTYK